MPCACSGTVPTSSGYAAFRTWPPYPPAVLPVYLLRRNSLYDSLTFWLSVFASYSQRCLMLLLLLLFLMLSLSVPLRRSLPIYGWNRKTFSHSEWRMILIPSVSCPGISVGFCIFSQLACKQHLQFQPHSPNQQVHPNLSSVACRALAGTMEVGPCTTSLAFLRSFCM